MSTTEQPAVGTIVHFDLTVDDAPSIRDFYTAVVGWGIEEMDMGDYQDYVLTSPTTGAWAGGICHARGVNADLPPQWLMYVQVADLEASLLERCVNGGGTPVTQIRGEPGYQYCVIQDPAGAVMALMQQDASLEEAKGREPPPWIADF